MPKRGCRTKAQCCAACRRIIIALIAQFYPKKYPDNWLLLLVCLVLYGIGTIALSLFTSLVEDECFLITKPRKVGPKATHMYILQLHSWLNQTLHRSPG